MTVATDPTRTLLALFSLKGIGAAALKKIAAVPTFWERSLEDLAEAVPQLGKSIHGESSGSTWQTARIWADEQIASAEKYDARIISAVDDEYPRLLAATKDDPFLLFVIGTLAKEKQLPVAIIGTREPTQHGQLIAQRITQFFVEQRWSVISGLAIGCDAVAHQTTIDAGGHTVAVLAHGLHMIAPSRHKKLAHDILDSGGALVSEYPFGANVLGAQFVKRDRTQAGLSRGVVMIQSDIKGGSLHASRAALDYKRWLAVPYPTEKDRENGEPKVQANLAIADGTDTERAELLRCPISSLHLVQVLRGREDYLRLTEPEGEAIAPVDGGACLLPNQEEPPIVAAIQERSAASQRRGNVLAPMSSEVLFPILRSTKEAYVLRGHEAEEHTPKTDASLDGSGPAIQRKTYSSYCLEVGPEDIANLKMVKLSPQQWGSATADRSSNYNVDVVLAVSRLDHLQAKLDELIKLLAPRRLIDNQNAWQSLFQVEDVLTHMKRATDELCHLDHGAHAGVLKSIMIWHGPSSSQSELPLIMHTEAHLRDAPLAEVLNRLIDNLPRSVSVVGQECRSDPRGDLGTKIHLGYLVLSFNELVKSALINWSSDTSRVGHGTSGSDAVD